MSGYGCLQRRKLDTKTVSVNDFRGKAVQDTVDANGYQVARYDWTRTKVDDSGATIRAGPLPGIFEAADQAVCCRSCYGVREADRIDSTNASSVVPFVCEPCCQSSRHVANMAADLEDLDVLPVSGLPRWRTATKYSWGDQGIGG